MNPVHIVGAGPGDPELLTVKALRLIQQAEIIFHDALLSPAILAQARPGTQMVDVGKRCGRASASQWSIQTRVIRAARKGLRVLRLKGGDPFIFGRGGEECLALAAVGIPFEIVPGITAAIGASAYAGVPLTHRGLAQSVTFVTGHAAPDADKPDWARLAQGADTLVIYMGMQALAEICTALIQGGRSQRTPAMAIHWGTTASQQHLTSTLSELADAVFTAQLGSPAIIVVGEVVSLSRQMDWFIPAASLPPLLTAREPAP